MHVPDVPAEGYEIQAPVVALNGLLDAADVDANGNDVDPDFSDEENEEANAPVGTTYQRSYRYRGDDLLNDDQIAILDALPAVQRTPYKSGGWMVIEEFSWYKVARRPAYILRGRDDGGNPAFDWVQAGWVAKINQDEGPWLPVLGKNWLQRCEVERWKNPDEYDQVMADEGYEEAGSLLHEFPYKYRRDPEWWDQEHGEVDDNVPPVGRRMFSQWHTIQDPIQGIGCPDDEPNEPKEGEVQQRYEWCKLRTTDQALASELTRRGWRYRWMDRKFSKPTVFGPAPGLQKRDEYVPGGMVMMVDIGGMGLAPPLFTDAGDRGVPPLLPKYMQPERGRVQVHHMTGGRDVSTINLNKKGKAKEMGKKKQEEERPAAAAAAAASDRVSSDENAPAQTRADQLRRRANGAANASKAAEQYVKRAAASRARAAGQPTLQEQLDEAETDEEKQAIRDAFWADPQNAQLREQKKAELVQKAETAFTEGLPDTLEDVAYRTENNTDTNTQGFAAGRALYASDADERAGVETKAADAAQWPLLRNGDVRRVATDLPPFPGAHSGSPPEGSTAEEVAAFHEAHAKKLAEYDEAVKASVLEDPGKHNVKVVMWATNHDLVTFPQDRTQLRQNKHIFDLDQMNRVYYQTHDADNQPTGLQKNNPHGVPSIWKPGNIYNPPFAGKVPALDNSAIGPGVRDKVSGDAFTNAVNEYPGRKAAYDAEKAEYDRQTTIGPDGRSGFQVLASEYDAELDDWRTYVAWPPTPPEVPFVWDNVYNTLKVQTSQASVRLERAQESLNEATTQAAAAAAQQHVDHFQQVFDQLSARAGLARAQQRMRAGSTGTEFWNDVPATIFENEPFTATYNMLTAQTAPPLYGNQPPQNANVPPSHIRIAENSGKQHQNAYIILYALYDLDEYNAAEGASAEARADETALEREIRRRAEARDAQEKALQEQGDAIVAEEDRLVEIDTQRDRAAAAETRHNNNIAAARAAVAAWRERHTVHTLYDAYLRTVKRIDGSFFSDVQADAVLQGVAQDDEALENEKKEEVLSEDFDMFGSDGDTGAAPTGVGAGAGADQQANTVDPCIDPDVGRVWRDMEDEVWAKKWLNGADVPKPWPMPWAAQQGVSKDPTFQMMLKDPADLTPNGAYRVALNQQNGIRYEPWAFYLARCKEWHAYMAIDPDQCLPWKPERHEASYGLYALGADVPEQGNGECDKVLKGGRGQAAWVESNAEFQVRYNRWHKGTPQAMGVGITAKHPDYWGLKQRLNQVHPSGLGLNPKPKHPGVTERDYNVKERARLLVAIQNRRRQEQERDRLAREAEEEASVPASEDDRRRDGAGPSSLVRERSQAFEPPPPDAPVEPAGESAAVRAARAYDWDSPTAKAILVFMITNFFQVAGADAMEMDEVSLLFALEQIRRRRDSAEELKLVGEGMDNEGPEYRVVWGHLLELL